MGETPVLDGLLYALAFAFLSCLLLLRAQRQERLTQERTAQRVTQYRQALLYKRG